MHVHAAYPMYLFVYAEMHLGAVVHKEKHFSFHHSCSFSNPKEVSPRTARCPEDGPYDGEQLRLPRSTELSRAWLGSFEGS